MSENERGAYSLAGLADCASPDSLESPGAVFLLRVADAVDELDEWTEDSAWEIADGAVPIYTYQKWQTFTDLAAWQEDVTEYGPVEDLDKAASLALYMIAERLALALHAEDEADEDEDEDE